jgi:hypothetical protein
MINKFIGIEKKSLLSFTLQKYSNPNYQLTKISNYELNFIANVCDDIIKLF